MKETLPKQELPEDWAQQVHAAFVDVQKWAIPVDAIAIPWAWRTGWQALASLETNVRFFGVPVMFAMVEKPIALVRSLA
jgi:hypothetical protein